MIKTGIMSLERFREGKLLALLSCDMVGEKTLGEWRNEVLSVAEGTTDVDVMLELADCDMFDDAGVHRALRQNPSVDLRVVEVAVRNLTLFCEDNWRPELKAELQAWQKKREEILSAA